MIASNWNQIKVNQFIELRRVNADPSDSIIDKYIDLVLTVSDLDEEYVEDLPNNELIKMVKKLDWTRKEPHKKYSKKLGDYEIIPFKKITWGMFIDLEYYYSKDYIENLTTICGILYRQQSKDDWNNKIIEPYVYDPKLRGQEFEQAPITAVYGVVSDYLDYRNSLVNGSYKELFSSMYDDDIDEELTPEEKAQVLKDIQEEKRFDKWAYESVTLNLAGGDVTKMKDILDMSLIYVLNMLSMQNDLK